MYCFRCGTKVDDKVEYCPHCGANIKEELSRYNYSPNENDYIKPTINLEQSHEEQFTYSKNYSNIKNTKINTNKIEVNKDSDYVKAYIGNNYEKIKNLIFSLPCFFLGPLYLFYRKLYSVSFIWLIFLIIFISSPILYFISAIIMATSFKSIYFSHITKKITTIEKTYQGLDYETIKDKCQKIGGTSLIIPTIIISIILMIIIVSIIVIVDNINNKFNTTRVNILKENKNYSINNLSYTIPKGFTINYSEDNKYHSYRNYYNDNTCDINLRVTLNADYYENELDYINSMIQININDEISPISTVSINSTEWTYVTVKSEYSTQTTYVVKKNNNLYKLETSSGNEDITICQQEFDKVINSLTLKK